MAVEGSGVVADMRRTVKPVEMPGGEDEDDEAGEGVAMLGVYRPLW